MLLLITACAANPALEHMKLGDDYLGKKNWDGAITEYQKALALDSSLTVIYNQLAVAYNNRGWAFNESKQWDSAIADFNKAIERNSKLHVAYNNRGWAYNGKGQVSLASAYQILDNGKYDPAMLELDKAIEQFTLAISDLNKAIALNSQLDIAKKNLAAAYSDRGHAYNLQKKWDKAIPDLNFAIELNPDLADAYNNRGWAYNGKREFETAIPDLDKAIKLAPQMKLAYNNRGWAYHEIDKYDPALTDLNKAIELDPKLAVAYLNRGITYYYKRMKDQAIADLKKVLELTKSPDLVGGAKEVLGLLGVTVK